MHLVLVTSPLDGTGPGRVMVTLAHELGTLGHEVTLATTHGPTGSTLIDDAHRLGVEIVHLGMRGILDPAGPRRLRSLLGKVQPEVIHTRTLRADLVGRAVAGRIPLINNIVNLYPDDTLAMHGRLKGRLALALARATRRKVRLFVTNAEALVEATSRAFGIPETNITVVHDGIDLQRWRAATPASLKDLGIDDGVPVCLTVARLHPQKGLEDLIDAAGTVLSDGPNVRFVIAGDGPLLGALTDRIQAQGLNGRVHLLGWRDDLPSLLARATISVLPSRFEGLPAAVIESMAAGVPVVATRVAGVPEIIENGVSGWLTEPGDPEALAASIAVALSSDIGKVGGRAQREAETRFSSGVMALAWTAVYTEVAATASP